MFEVFTRLLCAQQRQGHGGEGVADEFDRDATRIRQVLQQQSLGHCCESSRELLEVERVDRADPRGGSGLLVYPLQVGKEHPVVVPPEHLSQGVLLGCARGEQQLTTERGQLGRSGDLVPVALRRGAYQFGEYLARGGYQRLVDDIDRAVAVFAVHRSAAWNVGHEDLDEGVPVLEVVPERSFRAAGACRDVGHGDSPERVEQPYLVDQFPTGSDEPVTRVMAPVAHVHPTFPSLHPRWAL